MIAIVMLLTASNALVMYSFYKDCDPTLNGTLLKPDQTVPLLVMELFLNAPGMAGIFVAATYSGTMR